MVLGLSFDGCENIVSRYAVFWCCNGFVDAISPIPGSVRSRNPLFCETLIHKFLIFNRLCFAQPCETLLFFLSGCIWGCNTSCIGFTQKQRNLMFSPSKTVAVGFAGIRKRLRHFFILPSKLGSQGFAKILNIAVPQQTVATPVALGVRKNSATFHLYPQKRVRRGTRTGTTLFHFNLKVRFARVRTNIEYCGTAANGSKTNPSDSGKTNL